MKLNDLKQILEEKRCSCVIAKQDSVMEFYESGIKPLIKCLEINPEAMKDSIIADKVVGKAAALIMVYGGVKEVFTKVISEKALEVFSDNKISVSFEERVDYIINRKKDDMCPMEKLCLQEDSPKKAYELLRERILK